MGYGDVRIRVEVNPVPLFEGVSLYVGYRTAVPLGEDFAFVGVEFASGVQEFRKFATVNNVFTFLERSQPLGYGTTTWYSYSHYS